MDLVAACTAFVAVSERGSFTSGAAAARIPQSVASRRIAALERHLGGPLVDRSSRTARLTDFGQRMLPAARRLVRDASSLVHDAEQALLSPFSLAVPLTWSPVELARLDLEARRAGLRLELRQGDPVSRAELVRDGEVRAALVPVAAGEGAWRVPLGLAGSRVTQRMLHLDALRPSRSDEEHDLVRVWVSPEDDLPAVRDRLVRAAESAGLLASQVRVATGLAAALAEALTSSDLVLATEAEARGADLGWAPLAVPALERGVAVVAGLADDASRIRTALREPVQRMLEASI